MGNNFSVESPSCDQPFLPFLCGKRKYLYNMEENLEALHKLMQELSAMRNDLLKRVSKEEDIGLQVLQEVKGWISMVEEIEPKANRLLDESVSEIQRLSRYGYCTLIPASTYRYSEKVLMTLKGVKTLISKGVFEVVVHRALPPLVMKMPPIQLTVSQQNLFEKACSFLEEKNVGTLGIYGKSGVGKTTLLTKIKNKFQEAFVGLVIFVVVGSEEVESIQEEISNRLDLPQWRETKEEKAAEIFLTLKGKRFLLLLDGIQREVDLEEIGVPSPSRENGCKVVFTTRSREACDESKWVDAKVEITRLSPEEAWDLFQETVGVNTLRSHQDIPKLARVVASTCRGLPLALNLIGETMSRKRTVREWRYTIHVLASSTAEFPDMEDGALPILKSIYDNMSDENIRLCFLYCALFPENCDIRKEDLVNYWIGEGILAKEDRERAEIQGYEIICDLVRMRLLMESGNGYCVKMRGMVREMALWIASDFGRQTERFVMVGGERIHQLPMVNDWGMVRRMSVTSTQIQNISDSLQCSELTTLFFRRNRHLKWISGAFFGRMTSLVVLDLSFNRELAELPEEVSSLVLLRFLNLSWTCIKELPLGLKGLRSLIHLDLDYTSSLQYVDVIASLLNLQVLRLFQSVPIYLKLMEDIQLLTSLKELSLTVGGSSVLQRLLSIHRLASSIQRLHLTETTIADGGSLSLNAMFGLRELDILGCNIPEITTDWRNTIQRETVHLGNIEKIPQFRNIRTVTIHGCQCLRELTWLLLALSIRNLSLSECPLVEEVISKEKAMAKLGHTSEQPFQNLTKLVLDGLPELKSIYWTPLPFPVLEYLEIRRCPELKRLPFNSESAIGNQVEIKIEEQWIKVVEWEDEATKQRFSHFNNRDFPQMAEDPKMDGLTSESHPIQNIDLVGTTVDSKENSSANSPGAKAVQTVSERTTAPMSYGDIPEKLSLKDSLTAVRNATKAADRLHQVFRMQSFQRKQLSEFGDDEKIDISDNIAVSFAASKTKNPGHSDVSLSSAATHIQKKYRGWKKRKEFLLILQRIVKIQAHVRGHQVRKQYRTIIWSVGLLEKIILRWRRKGIGLRGFKRNAIAKTVETEPPVSAICPTIPQEDEYDFLKEGRKQTEERLQKALTRVKSMVQYPEARDQYRRLLTVVEGFRENEASSLVNCDEDDLIDILNDDTLMSISP